MRFKINTPPVIHQTLDGEAIVVNLDTGTYYSLPGVAAEIWAGVERGASPDEIVDEALRRYDAPRAVVNEAVTRFVEQLVEEELIVAAANAAASGPVTPGPAADGAGSNVDGHAAFVEPILGKFTDMQELLLLDPIHEVDEQGWPHTLEAASQTGEA